jgi:Phosphotransferase enzyme family
VENVQEITSLPWVLTHGDLVPGNIMLSTASGHLTGLVDWAEAEILSFGLCLYGLEEILGEMTETGWEYHPDAERLRQVFWRELGKRIGDVERAKVEMARQAGILLWWGIAWDDGRIDRVVEEGRDAVEVARLDAFLRPCEEGLERVSKL